MADETEGYTVGSGNVFADAGLPDADERLARARLMRRVTQLIAERNLSGRDVAALTGVPWPRISLLPRGRVTRVWVCLMCRPSKSRQSKFPYLHCCSKSI